MKKASIYAYFGILIFLIGFLLGLIYMIPRKKEIERKIQYNYQLIEKQ